MRGRNTLLTTLLLVSSLVMCCVSACTAETTAPRSTSSSSGSGSSSGEEEEEKDAGKGPAYVYDDGEGSGTTWKSIYADLFGPSGRASCAGTGSACHASASAKGGETHFVCDTEANCRETMFGASKMIEDADYEKPSQSLLVGILRKKGTNGSITGTQPKSPLFVFHEDSLERIKTWIQDGAQE